MFEASRTTPSDVHYSRDVRRRSWSAILNYTEKSASEQEIDDFAPWSFQAQREMPVSDATPFSRYVIYLQLK